jgi:hypothetical protein
MIQIKHISFSRPCKYFCLNIPIFLFLQLFINGIGVKNVSKKCYRCFLIYIWPYYVTLEMTLVVAQCAVLVTEYWSTVKSTWPLNPFCTKLTFCIWFPNADTFHYMYFPDNTTHVVFSLLPLLSSIKQNMYQINHFLVYCYFTLFDSSQRSVFLELKCPHSPCTNLRWINSYIYQIRIKSSQPFRLQQDAQTYLHPRNMFECLNLLLQ